MELKSTTWYHVISECQRYCLVLKDTKTLKKNIFKEDNTRTNYKRGCDGKQKSKLVPNP